MLHSKRGLGCAAWQRLPQRIDPYGRAKPCVDAALNVCSQAIPDVHCLQQDKLQLRMSIITCSYTSEPNVAGRLPWAADCHVTCGHTLSTPCAHLMRLAACELAGRKEYASRRLLSAAGCDLLPTDQDVREAGCSAARGQLATLNLGVT